MMVGYPVEDQGEPSKTYFLNKHDILVAGSARIALDHFFQQQHLLIF